MANPFNSKGAEPLPLDVWLVVVAIIFPVVEAIHVYEQYLALIPGESKRPSHNIASSAFFVSFLASLIQAENVLLITGSIKVLCIL